jgi:GntR family transcriptional regulator, arabinose operon transcriptional repressor
MVESLVSRLARQLQDDLIATRAYAPGDQLPTTRDLAARYGASVASVAHALEVLQAQGLVVKRRGAGCFLAEADAPASPKLLTNTLGCVMPVTLDTYVIARLHEGIQHACRRFGMHLMVGLYNHFQYEQERSEMTRLRQAGCRGLLLYPNPRYHDDLANDYLKSFGDNIPLVLMDLGLPEQGHIQVGFDNYQAAFELTCWLQAQGHKSIAIMIASRGGRQVCFRSIDDRMDGYRDAMRTAGIQVPDSWVWDTDLATGLVAQPSHMYSDFWIEHWKRGCPEVTALITLHDEFALDMIAAARQRDDLRIPEDLMIVGFDNLSNHRDFDYDFPTTKPDFCRMGSLAVELLMRCLNGRLHPPLQYMLPVPLRLSGEEGPRFRALQPEYLSAGRDAGMP